MDTVKDVQRQIDRAKALFELGSQMPDFDEPLTIAALYAATSAIQIMRHAAACGALTIDLKAFDSRIADLSPRFRLVRKLRNRDAHRYAVRGAGYGAIEYRVRMPPLGQASLCLDPSPMGPRADILVSDGSRDFEFLMVLHGFVQDHLEPVAISISTLLNEVIGQLEIVREEFARLRKPRRAA